MYVCVCMYVYMCVCMHVYVCMFPPQPHPLTLIGLQLAINKCSLLHPCAITASACSVTLYLLSCSLQDQGQACVILAQITLYLSSCSLQDWGQTCSCLQIYFYPTCFYILLYLPSCSLQNQGYRLVYSVSASTSTRHCYYPLFITLFTELQFTGSCAINPGMVYVRADRQLGGEVKSELCRSRMKYINIRQGKVEDIGKDLCLSHSGLK